MTPEQWKAVEKELSYPGGHAQLQVDGYKIDLIVEPYKALKYAIVVYIDGYLKGAWGIKDCPERQKFFCQKNKYFAPEKPAKGWKKKEWDEYRESAKYSSYYPWWTNFAELKRHFEKNNENIKLIEPAGDP